MEPRETMDMDRRATANRNASRITRSLAMVFGLVASAIPATAHGLPSPFCATTGDMTICSDLDDYAPHLTTHLNGHGFPADTEIQIKITRPDGQVLSGDGSGDPWPKPYDSFVTTSAGTWEFDYVLNGIAGSYHVEALQDGAVLATYDFLDAPPKADLDQCRNGTVASPVSPCFFQNGNVGSSQGHYTEGESVPYRMVLTNLDPGAPHQLTIEYDIRHSSRNAIDYLTYYDRIAEAVDPCQGISGTCALSEDFPVPAPSASPQPIGSFNALPAAEKTITIYNGDISRVSYVSEGPLSGATSSTSVRIFFNVTLSTSVIAWGGHIGCACDWGPGQSAGGISGSPYHMRLIDFDGGGGNQDRSLSADAVQAGPQGGSLTVEKFVVNDFGGTATPSDFSMHVKSGGVDVAGSPQAGSSIGTSYVNLAAGTYTVSEDPVSGYAANFSGDCASNGVVTLADGDAKTCTVTNRDVQPQLTVIKHVVNDAGGTAAASDFTMTVNATDPTDASFPGAESPGTTIGLDAGSYSVAESGPAGYGASSTSGCSGTIAIGQSKTCTFTNDDVAGTLTVVKNVTNDDGGDAVAADFDLTVDGDPVTSGDANSLAAGQYTVAETALAGYAFVGFSGACDAEGLATVAIGTSETCYLENDDIRPTLTVVKNVTNDAGGAATPDDFQLTVDGDAVTSGATNGFDAGAHTVAETTLPGYSFEGFSGACDAEGGVVLAPGDDETCYLENDDVRPTLTVIKNVTNDDGGDAVAADFDLTVDGDPVTSGDASGLDAGTHTVAEGALYGYAFVGFSGACDEDGNVTLAVGDDLTCWITNDDVRPLLTVIKNVTNDAGGPAEPDDFQLTVDGDGVLSGATNGFDAGTHAVAETTLPGYAFVAFAGACDADGNVTLAVGDAKTCWLTNDDVSPVLRVVKNVTNDDGGTLGPDDFGLTVDGGAVLNGSATALDAGVHTVAEASVFGYDFLGFSGACDEDGNVTLAVGDDLTCWITNDDVRPLLTVIKNVTNDDGGSAAADDFLLTIDGGSVLSGSTTGVDAGTHAVGETQLYGYDFLGFSGACDADGNVTLAVGESKTCWLENDDVAPLLTVVKNVTNDDGGDAEPDDFGLAVDGEGVLSGVPTSLLAGTHAVTEAGLDGYAFVGFSGACDADGNVTLQVGDDLTCYVANDDIRPLLTVVKIVTNDDGGEAEPDDFALTVDGGAVLNGTANGFDAGEHAVAETLLFGYTFEGFGGDCDANGTVVLHVGDDLTCTLANDDVRPLLTVVKNVTNDDGGEAEPDDFGLAVDGGNVTSGQANGFQAGEHTVTEAGLYGYDFVGFSGACDQEGAVILHVGDDLTCYLANDDVRPILTVVKNVTNDDGGPADPDDFLLTVDGDAVLSGAANGFQAGEHTVAETLLDGYTFEGFSGACDADGNVTLHVGDDLTCWLANDDVRPKLTVVKVVTNDDGGPAEPDDFLLTVDGDAVLNGTSNGYDAGEHVVGETLLGGYAFGGFSGACDENGTVVLSVGDDVTCTLENDDIRPLLTVVKNVTNDDGGDAEPDDFGLAVDGGGVFSGATNGFQAGEHQVSEAGLYGYDFGGFSGACDANGTVLLNVGDDLTCWLSNDDVRPTLTVIKNVTNDAGGEAEPDDFQLTVDGSPVLSGATNGFAAGQYTVGETTLYGYDFVAFTGDCDAVGNVTLHVGDEKTCWLANDDVAPILRVVKNVTNDDGGTLGPDDFGLAVDGTPVLNGSASALAAGAHNVSEAAVYGYDFGGFGGACDETGSVVLHVGDDLTCYLENDDIRPKITVVKNVTNDDGGLAAPDDFALTIDGSAVLSGAATGVAAGTHTAAETAVFGYDFVGFSGACDEDGNVTVSVGDDLTCYLANDDVAPLLTVVKNVTNDDGGLAEPDDFDLTVDGQPVLSGATTSLAAGTHTVAETQLYGYDFLGFSGACDPDGNVTLAVGESKTCWLTNDDVRPLITVVKNVTNDDGGLAEADDFDLTVGGTPVLSGATNGFEAGTYAVGETPVAGYAFGGFSGACDETGNVTVAVGDDVTCWLTNDDVRPLLTVVKNVTNDDGGDAEPDDFDLTVDGQPVLSGVTTDLPAGTYAVGETLLFGYTFEGYSGACDADGNVTLTVGESKTCWLTNDDVRPTLTVVKNVTNDDGGLAQPDDFQLTVGGTPVISGAATGFDAGAYAVGETPVFGYAFQGFSGDCDQDGNVTLAVGESKTCWIENDDVAPLLTLVKNVTNDDGGLAEADDFDLTVDGSPVLSGATTPLVAGTHTAAETQLYGYEFLGFSGDCDQDGNVTLAVGESKTCWLTNDDVRPLLTVVKNVTNDDGGDAEPDDFGLAVDGEGVLSGAANGFDAGTHQVGEAGLFGYAFGGFGGACDADGNVTLHVGDDLTCWLTNDDVRPQLRVVKNVTNDDGGTAAAADFALTLDGDPVASGAWNGVQAGTHAVAETTVAGYAFAGFSGACDADGNVTLSVGENETCWIENDDVPGTLTVIKHVINDNGGASVAENFTLDVAGLHPSPASFAGSETGVAVTIGAGAYNVTEPAVPGYTTTYSAGCAGVMALAGNATCVVTNDDKPQTTRTQGFWSTHTTFTSGVFAAWLGGNFDVGTTAHKKTIDTTGKLFGAWESSIAKKTTGAQRPAVDKARMVLLQQLVTAKLNCAAFGCTPAVQALIAQADAAYASTNTMLMALKTLQLDQYNNSGDALPIPPTLGPVGKATPKTSQALANKVFWDSP